MRLTQSAGYALGILLRIEAAKSEGPLTAAKIAKGCSFPPRFLYRVLRRLVSSGLLTGVSGPGGGYALARPAEKISLWDIASAVEGAAQTAPLKPVSKKQTRAIRFVNQLLTRNHERFRADLRKVSLRKLAQAR
jgi:Rrf2 family transcriptional regulator, iron-sulfur cluster assembly transcription factor